MALPLDESDFIEFSQNLFAIRRGPSVYVLGKADYINQISIGTGSGLSMRCLVSFSAYDTRVKVCGELQQNRVNHAPTRELINEFRRQYCKTVIEKDLHKKGLHFTGVKRLVHHHK